MAEKTMIAELLRKKADTLAIQERSGNDLSAALNEIDRQIRQCLTGGDPVRGKEITKSGVED